MKRANFFLLVGSQYSVAFRHCFPDLFRNPSHYKGPVHSAAEFVSHLLLRNGRITRIFPQHLFMTPSDFLSCRICRNADEGTFSVVATGSRPFSTYCIAISFSVKRKINCVLRDIPCQCPSVHMCPEPFAKLPKHGKMMWPLINNFCALSAGGFSDSANN